MATLPTLPYLIQAAYRPNVPDGQPAEPWIRLLPKHRDAKADAAQLRDTFLDGCDDRDETGFVKISRGPRSVSYHSDTYLEIYVYGEGLPPHKH